MAIVWDEDSRRAVSRRLVKLPTEISILTETVDNLTDTVTAYNKVDYSNGLFLQEWMAVSVSYLNENLYLQGEAYLTFDNTDLPPIADPFSKTGKFYPFVLPVLVPDTNNYFLNPQINGYTKSGRDSLAVSCEEWIAKSYQGLINSLKFGWGGGAGAVSTTTGGNYNGGNTLDVVDATNISDGSVLLIDGDDGTVPPPITNPVAHQNVVYVVSGGGTVGATTLGVFFIGGGGLTVSGATVIISTLGVVWTDVARLNFPVAPYLDAANAIQTFMDNIAQWSTYMGNENVELLANTDARNPQAAQNATAIVNTTVGTAPVVSALAVWLALAPAPSTQYQDAGLNPLLTAVDARVLEINTRITEIITAKGDVIDGGDGTFTATGAIGMRYQWLGNRINKNYGSLSQEDGSNIANAVVAQQLLNSTNTYDSYSLEMKAVSFEGEDEDIFAGMPGYETVAEDRPLNTIVVVDTVGFSNNDNVYVADEVTGHAELSGQIMTVDSVEKKIVLNFDVPLDYTSENLARIYKTLP